VNWVDFGAVSLARNTLADSFLKVVTRLQRRRLHFFTIASRWGESSLR
jgi:hypothetical protein